MLWLAGHWRKEPGVHTALGSSPASCPYSPCAYDLTLSSLSFPFWKTGRVRAPLLITIAMRVK